ncbi:MAG: hypothetical protein RRY12_01425 [Cloacibacillus sp.]
MKEYDKPIVELIKTESAEKTSRETVNKDIDLLRSILTYLEAGLEKGQSLDELKTYLKNIRVLSLSLDCDVCALFTEGAPEDERYC